MNRLALSLHHLLRYAVDGEYMLNSSVTEDETWVHHYQPESKRASMRWKHPSSPQPKILAYAITWEGYTCRVLGFSGSTLSPFSEM
jgi:hypothetical protein